MQVIYLLPVEHDTDGMSNNGKVTIYELNNEDQWKLVGAPILEKASRTVEMEYLLILTLWKRMVRSLIIQMMEKMKDLIHQEDHH